ncbi:MAG: hypothetical protein HGA96_16090 [Desulfobulbaceae bacterium]|nr:hypothetical protein [Desulfobulbaceae bacterium]
MIMVLYLQQKFTVENLLNFFSLNISAGREVAFFPEMMVDSASLLKRGWDVAPVLPLVVPGTHIQLRGELGSVVHLAVYGCFASEVWWKVRLGK